MLKHETTQGARQWLKQFDLTQNVLSAGYNLLCVRHCRLS